MASISEYVKGLDRHQLHYLTELARERIEEIAREEKKVIWVVEDKCDRHELFPSEGYIDAACALFNRARNLAQQTPRPSLLVMELRLTAWLVHESEYARILGGEP
jgi:hypothetical protein